MVRKVKSQLEALFFNCSDPILIISFFATFKFACDTKRVYGEAAVRVLLLSVRKARASTLNSYMSAATIILSAIVFIQSEESLRQNKLFLSYFEVITYPLEKSANDQAIAEMDSAIFITFNRTA